MYKKFELVTILILMAITISPAEQPNAISMGLLHARGFGLVGDPTEITIAKMSYVEYRELIGDPYHGEHHMEVWVLSMRGKVLLRLPGASPEECDNIFVVLNAQTGELKAVGARKQALQVPGEKVTIQDGPRFPIPSPYVPAPGPVGPTSTPAPLNRVNTASTDS